MKSCPKKVTWIKVLFLHNFWNDSIRLLLSQNKDTKISFTKKIENMHNLPDLINSHSFHHEMITARWHCPILRTLNGFLLMVSYFKNSYYILKTLSVFFHMVLLWFWNFCRQKQPWYLATILPKVHFYKWFLYV